MKANRASRRVRGLYGVTPDAADTSSLVALVGAAVAGGMRLVQYRNKLAAPELRLEQARALKTVCARHGALMIVNDDVGVARAVDADGVHLGREDSSAADARQALGPEKLIGISCYNSLELARSAQTSGADYVAFGSFFPSRVKPGAVCASVVLLKQAKRELAVPIVAIGGITVANASQLIGAGANAVAVISALFAAPDVASAAAQFESLFDAPGET